MRLVAPHQFLESNNNKMASYFDQTNNPTGESFNDNPINNKSDLIDRLASSKSLNYIWTNDSESSKNKTSTSNSLPVDTLIQKYVSVSFTNKSRNSFFGRKFYIIF